MGETLVFSILSTELLGPFISTLNLLTCHLETKLLLSMISLTQRDWKKASRVSASVIPVLYVPDTILPTVVTKTSKYFLSLLKSYFMD